MSLKAFHIVFISASILLALGASGAVTSIVEPPKRGGPSMHGPGAEEATAAHAIIWRCKT